MLFADEEGSEAGQVLSAAAPPPDVATSPAGRPATTDSPPPVFHPLAYRGVVADWPLEWRERWGRRANALEEDGLSWRDAETQAFIEVWTEYRNQQPPAAPATELSSSSPERN
jgi:hypothetical protein